MNNEFDERGERVANRNLLQELQNLQNEREQDRVFFQQQLLNVQNQLNNQAQPNGQPQPAVQIVRQESSDLPIDNFDPEKGETFRNWLTRFDRIGTARNWDGITKRNNLAARMRGIAEIHYDNLSPEDKTNYESLKTALTEKLEPTNDMGRKLDKLLNRKQTTEESVEKFSCILVALMRQAHPNEDVLGTKNELLMTIFTKGLLPKFRVKVRESCPTTFQEAVAKGRAIEDSQEETCTDEQKADITSQLAALTTQPISRLSRAIETLVTQKHIDSKSELIAAARPSDNEYESAWAIRVENDRRYTDKINGEGTRNYPTFQGNFNRNPNFQGGFYGSGQGNFNGNQNFQGNFNGNPFQGGFNGYQNFQGNFNNGSNFYGNPDFQGNYNRNQNLQGQFCNNRQNFQQGNFNRNQNTRESGRSQNNTNYRTNEYNRSGYHQQEQGQRC